MPGRTPKVPPKEFSRPFSYGENNEMGASHFPWRLFQSGSGTFDAPRHCASTSVHTPRLPRASSMICRSWRPPISAKNVRSEASTAKRFSAMCWATSPLPVMVASSVRQHHGKNLVQGLFSARETNKRSHSDAFETFFIRKRSRRHRCGFFCSFSLHEKVLAQYFCHDAGLQMMLPSWEGGKWPKT